MAAKDHYIPRAYLHRFTDAAKGGKLHAYSKRTGRSFRPTPGNVCAERDGDRNAKYLRDRDLRRDYRALYEGYLPNSIVAFENRRATPTDKHIVSMFMAALMICTPAWRRVGSDMLNSHLRGRLIHEKKMGAKHGTADDTLVESVTALERGEIAIEHDPAYVEARATINAMPSAVSLYQEDWIVSVNSTAMPFVTGDSPCAIDWVSITTRPTMFRHLPLSPLVSVTLAHSGRFNAEKDPAAIGRILSTPQERGVRYTQASSAFVDRVNDSVIQCAEDLVFSNHSSDAIAARVAKYAKHRLIADYVEFEDRDGALIQGARLKINEA